MLRKQARHNITNVGSLHLHEICTVGKFRDAKDRLEVTGNWEWEELVTSYFWLWKLHWNDNLEITVKMYTIVTIISINKLYSKWLNG